MRGDPVVMGRLIGGLFILLTLLVADVVWEIRKWTKKD